MTERIGPYELGRVHHADCLDAMRELPDGCVQCCVTSPPYWGLRKYDVPDLVFGSVTDCEHDFGPEVLRGGSKGGQGRGGQLADRAAAQGQRERSSDSLGSICRICGAWRGQFGLEPTPDLYVSHMVGIFREVRRVLRDDGTLWLNLGPSYATEDAPDGTLTIRSRCGAPSCGSGGTEPPGSQGADRACLGSCGGHQVGIPTRHARTSHSDRFGEQVSQQTSQRGRDTERQDCGRASVACVPHDAPGSTTRASRANDADASSPALQGAGRRGDDPTSPVAMLGSSGKGQSMPGTLTSPPPSVVRISGKGSLLSACGSPSCLGLGRCGLCWCSLAIPSLGVKRKDLLPIPWLVAMALQADGWFVRSEIIWHKTAPMPESVRDRPTRAHEQVFLLSKSADYFYNDHEASEPASGTAHPRGNGVNPKTAGAKRGTKQNPSFSAACSKLVERRNWRTVWTIGPEPNNAQHYAPFPRELARRCIVAGSKAGDVVLDPFAGTGTTVRVADGLQRKAIGFDLGAGYVAQANERSGAVRPADATVGQQAGLFAALEGDR